VRLKVVRQVGLRSAVLDCAQWTAQGARSSTSTFSRDTGTGNPCYGNWESLLRVLGIPVTGTGNPCYGHWESLLRVLGIPVAGTGNPCYGYWESLLSSVKQHLDFLEGHVHFRTAVLEIHHDLSPMARTVRTACGASGGHLPLGPNRRAAHPHAPRGRNGPRTHARIYAVPLDSTWALCYYLQ
jgi:hypothetical protein